ncbi:MAG: class I SAM-dependent methyltransferase [Chloroflexi bacterium]|nr:class I SAM-dependent methyltransferase [Chloroflexota bacterium]
MSTHDKQQRERPSTYFVQDRSNEEELKRLQLQDRLVTADMGGVLPEQPDPTIFHRVLDIGCGTGDWLIETAKTYPSISLLMGVDISQRMVGYARAQAEERQVSDRVEFHVMDVLLMLEFPSGYFDLVNQRFAQGYLRTWDWPKLLQECLRVSRPGGVIRLTDVNFVTGSSSPALNRLHHLFLQALYQAGHYFTLEGNGLITQLERLLRQHGVQNVQTRPCTLEYRAGTAGGQQYAEDMRLIFRTMVPFLRKWIRVPDDYEEIYQRAMSEMQEPDFVATWELLTAWGTTP